MPPLALAVAAPARVRLLLAESDEPARIVHRGRHALYVEVAGRCVGVVSTAASAVPCALRVSSPDLGDLASASSARVASGALHLDEVVLRVGRVVDVSAPSLVPGALERFARLGLDGAVPPGVRDALPRRALEQLGAGDPGAVPALLGLGEGLTPLGDDVLCGWLALRRAAGAARPAVETAVRDGLERTGLLSATLLDCALHGEVLPEFADLLRRANLLSAAEHGDPAPLVAAAHALTRVGHTSGAGLLLGAVLAAGDLAAGDLAAVLAAGALAAPDLSIRSTRSTPIPISEGRRCA